MKTTMKKMVTTFAAALLAAISALADGNAALPVAKVTKVDAASLEAWKSTIKDFSSAVEAHTTNPDYASMPIVCSNVVADVGYVFEADPDDVDNAYSTWYADYVVSFDGPIAKNAMGLVGAYQNWTEGSLGFFAPLEIGAKARIPLLNSVMRRSNWTYKKIRDNVGAFTCGAFNLAEDTIGTKMTVELRIFDPAVFTSTDMICNPANWNDGVNTFVIKSIDYKLDGRNILEVNGGSLQLVCSGIADGTTPIPAGVHYLDSGSGEFVLATDSVQVSQRTAYFVPPVCAIGKDGYTTLAKAVACAEDGDTIRLLADNAESFTTETARLFMIDTNGCAFVASNVTPMEGCELVQNLDGTYTHRMRVVVKDLITKNVVETKVEDEIESAAVAITDDNFNQLFPAEGAKTLEIVASGVGTVSFDPEAVTKIGQNITNVIEQAGGNEFGATAKTTVTVAIADVTKQAKEEDAVPEVIITTNGTLEVVQAISVTAILRTIVKQAQSETAVTNEEVYAAAKAAGISTVTIPYTGIAPQVWYINTEKTPWETNAMATAYNAGTKELSFKVYHFSDYVITDAETYAMVGTEKFRTLQEAFDWVETNQTQGTTITLTKDSALAAAATFNGEQATLDMNGKTITGAIANNGILTVAGNGTIDAGGEVFATGSALAKTYVKDGTYLGAFPDPTGLATNAGPLLVSGGKFQSVVPWAYCAPGYEPNETAVGGFYTVKNANIYIRDIGACQRYPWNGYVDIDFDVCWDAVGTAKLYVSAWDVEGATPVQLTMKNAILIEEGVVGQRDVDCEKGFEVVASSKKHLHLIWNSAAEGVPTGTKKNKVGFKFLAK